MIAKLQAWTYQRHQHPVKAKDSNICQVSHHDLLAFEVVDNYSCLPGHDSLLPFNNAVGLANHCVKFKLSMAPAPNPGQELQDGSTAEPSRGPRRIEAQQPRLIAAVEKSSLLTELNDIKLWPSHPCSIRCDRAC
jgi:hypothetical protein